MQKTNNPKISTIHISSLPKGLQEAIAAYNELAEAGEDFIKDAIPIVFKKNASGKTIDFIDYKSSVGHEGWELEFVHPDIFDELVAEKVDDGDVVFRVGF